MILLEDEANPIPNFVEGKIFHGIVLDRRVRLHELILKIQRQVLDIFDKDILLLHEKICVLSHALIGCIIGQSRSLINNYALLNKMLVLEVLISFL